MVMKRKPPAAAAGAPTADAALGHAATGLVPLYRQIKKLMTQSLGQGEWRPGEVMPSEPELAERYKVSQGTVRKALDELVAENLVVRRQGIGTFVATHQEAQVRFRFLRLMPMEGERHAAENRVLSCERLRAVSEIARQLDLKAGDAVLRIHRVLLFAGVPTVLDEIWLPAHLFKGLTLERLQSNHATMYAQLEVEFGIRMLRAREKIRAVLADAETAAILGVGAGTPLLSVERVAVTYGERPVEVRKGLYLTQDHYYRNDLG